MKDCEEWMSIESAPLDGRSLLVGWWRDWPDKKWITEVAPAGNIDIARSGCGSLHGYATHWKHLPDPPK